MRFTIEKNHLQETINTVSKGMSVRSTLPVVGGIYIEAASDGVIFQTTDLEISIKHIADALVEQQGKIVVSGKLFSDIVKSLPEAAVEIYLDGEQLVLVCLESRFTLNTMNPIDFPAFPQIISTRSIDINAEELTSLVKKVFKAVSHDESRAVLTGIYFKVETNLLQLVATDSYRLAISKSNLGNYTEEPIDLIIPGSVLDEVSKLAKSQAITIGETENQIIFSFGTTTFISRKIEGNYPNYEQIIPPDKNLSCIVDTELLRQAIKRTSILAQVHTPIKLSFNSEEQLVIVSARTQDIGEAQEKVPAQIEGESIEIGFNHQYIIDGLNGVESDEVLFEAQSALKPGIIKAVGEKYYFYLTMPVRL
jgi:DNA polymerase-3 subunit beta